MSIKEYYTLVYIWIICAMAIFPLVLKIKAPYGRHVKTGWGPMIDNRLAWIFMEAPSLILVSILFISGKGEKPAVTWLFYALFAIHYFNRTFIFPLRLRTKGKKMPATVALMAVFFNLINGFIIGYYLGTIATNAHYTADYTINASFYTGIILFCGGFVINWYADHILINLRKPGETGYKIPDKGWISCPNHFGEIVEWTGFAIMTWSLAGLSFALWTFVNLMPRALQHHQWYKATFSDYPSGRKALIPYIL
jgi:steroid 5-alpha reductase family enzyme